MLYLFFLIIFRPVQRFVLRADMCYTVTIIFPVKGGWMHHHTAAREKKKGGHIVSWFILF